VQLRLRSQVTAGVLLHLASHTRFRLTPFAAFGLAGIWKCGLGALAIVAWSGVCRADDLPSMAIRDGSFLGLRFGMSLQAAQQAGAKYIEKRDSGIYEGNYAAGYLPVDFPNSVLRQLYFQPDFGLYRLRITVTGPGQQDFRYDKFLDFRAKLEKAFADVNPGTKVIRRQRPDVKDLRLDTMQECPKGSDQVRGKLADASFDNLREIMRKDAQGNESGHDISPDGLMFAVYCGALPSPVTTAAVPEELSKDTQVVFGGEVTGPFTLRFVFVIVNNRIAEIARRKGRAGQE
jgi:hypothetical protein